MVRFGLMVIALASAGCGLSDYEKRMDEQRERLKLFDEESALLFDIIDMPSGKDAYGNEIKPPFELFLRLPVGFSGKFEGLKSIFTGDKVSLYRFVGSKTDVNVLVGWALLAENNPKTPTKQEGLLADDFRAKVRMALIDYISRTYSIGANPPEFKELKKESRQVLRDGIKRNLDFEYAEFVDSRQNKYAIYFHEWSDRQAAVIYQVPAAQAGQQQRLIDVSLKTIEISPIAAAKRADFRSRPR